MDFFSRKLLSDDDEDDDDLKELCNRCFYHLPDHCPSDCLENCSKPCSYFQFSIPPTHSDEFNPTIPPKSPHKLSHWVTATIALLSFTFLLVLCYAVYVRFYSRRRNAPPPTTHLDEEQHGPDLDHPIWYIRTVGLPAAVIDSIALVEFKSGEGLIDGTECSVCLTEFEEDETLRVLPKCSHAFHLQCIHTWLRSHTNCPMCRAPVALQSAVFVPPPLPPAAVSEETETGESSVRYVEQEQEGIELGIGDFQGRRRSVSLDDSLSGVGISGVLNEDELKKSSPNCSAAMNRSVSCSGKFLIRSSTQRSCGVNQS